MAFSHEVIDYVAQILWLVELQNRWRLIEPVTAFAPFLNVGNEARNDVERSDGLGANLWLSNFSADGWILYICALHIYTSYSENETEITSAIDCLGKWWPWSSASNCARHYQKNNSSRWFDISIFREIMEAFVAIDLFAKISGYFHFRADNSL